MAAPFSRTEEKRLIGHVREIQSHIDGGSSPNDAIVKVARDRGVHPDSLPLLIQACNVGRASHQREKCSGNGVSCMLEEFPLADIGAVKTALYPSDLLPSKEAQAEVVSSQYSRPPVRKPRAAPQRQKAASAPAVKLLPPLEPKDILKKRYAIKQAAARGESEVRSDASDAFDNLAFALGRLNSYFKQADAIPSPEVEYNARRVWGTPVTAVFDCLATNHKKMARATNEMPPARRVEFASAPYSLVKSAIDRGHEYKAAKEAIDTFHCELKKRLNQLDGIPEPPRTKSALLGSLSTGIAAGLSGGISGSLMSGTHDKVKSVSNKLEDPAHLDDLRTIQTRAVLGDMMNNDEVISGYDPHEVTQAYNEIVNLTPSVATQPAALRPWLRRRLTTGTTEPFDVGEMAKMESTLRNNRGMGEEEGGEEV